MELLSRMLSAVEGQAFGELADLAGANAAATIAPSRVMPERYVDGEPFSCLECG